MSFFARLRSRRAAIVAIAAVIGVTASTATQIAVAPAPAISAGSNFLCDNNTIYGIVGTGAATGDVMQINASTGASSKVATVSPGTNALGITKNGTQAWAYQGNSTTVVEYDAVTGTTTPHTAGNSISAIRGAVDPVNSIFYYASGTATTDIYGYNTATNTAIGKVGTFTGGKGSNGDMAFGTDGTLYLVDSDQVFRISNLPSTAGATALTGTLITTLPAGTNSPGIAYSSDGYLYLVQNTTSSTLYQIDPGTGVVKNTLTISTGAGIYDLASCNYANSLTTKVDVRSRSAATDEFTVTNVGFTSGNSATTAGSATGVQPQVAGPSLAVGGATYSVTQAAAGSTTLANYSVGWKCFNNTSGTTVASGTGNTASFTYPAATTADGSDVVCTFLDAVKPVANPDANTTPVNTALSSDAAHNLLQNDTGATIAVTTTGAQATTHGSATVNADGSYSYTPNTDFSGTDSFPYTIADVNGTTAGSTATITVTPKATDDSASTATNTPVLLSNLTSNDHGTSLKVTSVPATSTHGTVSVDATGVVTYTPNAGFAGTDSFVYTATDSSGQTTTATVTVTVAGAVNDTATTKVDVPVTTPVLTANDNASGGVTQSIGTPVNGGHAVLNGDGTVTYTPPAGYSGTDTFSYTAKDSHGQTYTGSVTITINPIANDDTATTPAGTAKTVGGLTGNDKGSPTLTVTSIAQPTSGGTAVLNGDGSVTLTPAAGFSGLVHIPYTITDPSGLTATADVIVNVTPLGQDDAGTTPVNTTLTKDAAHGVLANDTGSLSVSSHSAVSHGALTIAADGSYVYTPTAGYSGPDAFDYVATDGNGNTVAQHVVLTVTPTAAADTANTVVNQAVNSAVRGNDHGSSLTITGIGTVTHGSAAVGAGGTIDFTPATDYSGTATVPYTVTDASGQSASSVLTVTVTPTAGADSTSTTVNTPVTVSQVTLIANDHGTTLTTDGVTIAPQHGTTQLNGDHSITYTPAANYSGTDVFTYEVTDPSGNKATAQVSVVIGNVATPDSGTTPVNTTLNVNAANGVLTNDVGTHPMTATILTNPAHGTVTLNSDGSYQYVPTHNFSGTDTFTYTATDASSNTATGTVTISVTPTAADDSMTVSAGSAATVTAAPGLLGNDVGTGLTVTTTGTFPTTQGGSVTVSANGSYSYTPPANYSGPDSFAYTAQDSAGQTVGATVNITVTPTAPAADPTTTAGTPVTVDAAHGLLVGATGTGLTASPKDPPAHGSVAINPDGSYTYTPAPGFTGTDTFTYTVTDSSNQKTTGTATVTVEPLAAASNDSKTATSGQPTTIDPLVNDSATGGQTFDLATLHLVDPGSNASVLQVTVPNQGTWSVQAGKLQFTPDPGFVGTTSMAYRITDTSGVTVTATDSIVYPQLTTLAHTGTDAAQFDGSLLGGLLAMILGVILLLVARLRRTSSGPRHRTA